VPNRRVKSNHTVKRMLEQAEIRIVLVDHSKFGRKVTTRACGFEMIEHLVVDRTPESERCGGAIPLG
jgi:DeoR/GlpR family transcriptional regulator of sugar metabolism